MGTMDIITHDIIIIGAGLAGQMAALAASAVSDTAIVSKVHPTSEAIQELPRAG
jgi:succinate dehydrogenase/fumarate reductase flavoprotein subunit